MELFRTMLRAVGLLEPSKVDFISELPPEVSELILCKLDPESLLCAAQVSRKWLNVCRSARRLRWTARDHQQRTRRRMREDFLRSSSPVEDIKVVRKVRDIRKISKSVVVPRFEAAVIFGRPHGPRVRQTSNRIRECHGINNKVSFYSHRKWTKEYAK
ncbi:unnamed protein product [Xylocopa violacea]|uniref:F-box domain-containing protein n=1 Tax=Xylocopa violacea TaxID=135666 RepID=A0ABP1PIA8_XYLVO